MKKIKKKTEKLSGIELFIQEIAEKMIETNFEKHKNYITLEEDKVCDKFIESLDKIYPLYDNMDSPFSEDIQDMISLWDDDYTITANFDNTPNIPNMAYTKYRSYIKKYQFFLDFKFFCTEDERFKKANTIIFFDDFERLCDSDAFTALKLSERVHLLFKIIEKNIRLITNIPNPENCVSINSEYIYNLPVKRGAKVAELCMDESIYRSLEKKEDITEEEKQGITDMRETLEDQTRKMYVSIDLMNILNEIYLSKQESVTKDDIEETCEILSKLGITPGIIAYFKTKNIEKLKVKENNIEASKPITKVVYTTESTKKYYTEAEFKKMKKEVEMYRDKMIADEEIDLPTSELLRIAKNFAACYEDVDGGIHFLKYCNYYKKDQQKNPLADYVHLYERLKFYEGRFNMYKPLSDIKECLENMMICTDEDYAFYKQVLEETLTGIRSYMGHSYDYEKDKVLK